MTDAEIESVEVGHFDATSRTFTVGASPKDSIRVTAVRTLNMAFAPVIGIKKLTVRAHSVAQLFAADSVTGLAMPWVIEFDTNAPPAKGATVDLRTGGTPTGGTWRLPSDSNSGSLYRTRIENGFEGTLSVGDTIELVPGLKVGPTSQGVNYRIGLDPNATFATVKSTSPRIVIVPFIAPGTMGSGNGAPEKVIGFASFFLTGSQHGAVQGQYLNVFGGKSVSRRPPSTVGPNTALLVE